MEKIEEIRKQVSSLHRKFDSKSKDQLEMIFSTSFNKARQKYTGVYPAKELENIFHQEIAIPFVGGICKQAYDMGLLEQVRENKQVYYAFPKEPVHKKMLMKLAIQIWDRKKIGKSDANVERHINILKNYGYKILRPILDEDAVAARKLLMEKGIEVPEIPIEYKEV